jgi:hypothetical protein
MTGFCSDKVLAWTFPDGSSLNFCLAEELTHDFDLNIIIIFFLKSDISRQNNSLFSFCRKFDENIIDNKEFFLLNS